VLKADLQLVRSTRRQTTRFYLHTMNKFAPDLVGDVIGEVLTNIESFFQQTETMLDENIEFDED